MKCLRCGEQTPRLTVHQIHCPRCAVEVATLITPKKPVDPPAWLARLQARDMTGALR